MMADPSTSGSVSKAEDDSQPYVFRNVPQEVFERITKELVGGLRWRSAYPILQRLSSVSRHWRHMIYGIPKFSATVVLYPRMLQIITADSILTRHGVDTQVTVLCLSDTVGSEMTQRTLGSYKGWNYKF